MSLRDKTDVKDKKEFEHMCADGPKGGKEDGSKGNRCHYSCFVLVNGQQSWRKISNARCQKAKIYDIRWCLLDFGESMQQD
jgi:hypothetical protein